MTIGLIYHGKDKDVVVMGETFKDALNVYKDNLGTLMHLVQSGEVQEAGTVVTLS